MPKGVEADKEFFDEELRRVGKEYERDVNELRQIAERKRAQGVVSDEPLVLPLGTVARREVGTASSGSLATGTSGSDSCRGAWHESEPHQADNTYMSLKGV